MPLKFNEIKKNKKLSLAAGVVGRESGNPTFSKDTKISRKHFEIIIKKEKAYIKDLNSSNGTIVNGVNLVAEKLYELEIDDVLEIGNQMLKLTAIIEVPEENMGNTKEIELNAEKTETIKMSDNERTQLREDLIKKIDEKNKIFEFDDD